ncbi:MAG: T9SS type A sorting domain-containing protein [Bacteroidia bacterium]|nr:T9SS type A sorting domain-containing protein [Bacteroidia bacterium]
MRPIQPLIVGILFFLCSSAMAQVSLSNGNFPKVGDLLRYSIPDSLPDYAEVVTNAGNAASWDFTYFNAIAQRTDSFISLNAVPFTIRFFFPTSVNLVQYIETPDSVAGFSLSGGYQLFQVSSGAYINHGFASTLSGLPVSLRNNPSDTIFTLPLVYAASGTSVSRAVLDIPGIGYIEQNRTRVWDVDAEGSLTTPFGTFPSLRVHSIVTGNDSIAFDTLTLAFDAAAQETYDWYSPDFPGPMLSVTVGGQDSLIQFISNVSYADSLRDVFQIQLSNERQSVQHAAIYPNPNQGSFRIDLPESVNLHGTIKVFSMDGKLLWQDSLSPVSDLWIQLPDLPNGIYQVIVERDDSVFQGKLLLE